MHIRKLELLAALAITVAVPGSAMAHATFETPNAASGSYYKAVLQIPHGCDGQATLKVRVVIPEGVIAVKPMPKAGWTLETVEGAYAAEYELHGRKIAEGVKELVWTGELADEHFDQFVFQANLTDKLPVDKTVYFPVTQECASGQNAWVEIPAEGQDPHALKRPAPGVAITAAEHKHH